MGEKPPDESFEYDASKISSKASLKTPLLLIGIVGVLILTVLSASFYQVGETEQIIITQFGAPVGDLVTRPGLHVKVPFIQTATKFDKRLLEWDGVGNQVPTRDKHFIWVDTYASWRIDDPLLFFQRLRDERGAQTRLDDILNGETRDVVARYDLVEVVRSSNRDADGIQSRLAAGEGEVTVVQEIAVGREAITREILARASERARDLGIAILDVRFKRLNYVSEERRDVIARTIADNRKKALDLYQEALHLLETDDIDDSKQQGDMAVIEAKIRELQEEPQ
jgi:membrane protease subunit HflC